MVGLEHAIPRFVRLISTEMHDETFLVTQGKMQFHGLHGETIEAKLGDYVTVPTRSPHTFSNPYDEEAKFFNTYTPAFYINYFKMLSKMSEEVSSAISTNRLCVLTLYRAFR